MTLQLLRASAPPPDPHAGVRIFSEYAGDLEAEAEILVVGSGPSGAVVAKELAEAGKDVLLVEEGPPFGAKDFGKEPGEALHQLLREGGMRAARGNVFMPTMQAIALGGGSIVNSAICCRAPAWVFDKWRKKTGTSISLEDLEPHYERVERFLGVAPTPDEVLGERNLRFKRGCDALGISSAPTPRNVRGCRGSGECFTGCRTGAKQSVDVSYVPAAIRAGARVLTSVRIDRLSVRAGRAQAAEGRIVEPLTGRPHGKVRIRAGTIVLAAGCMASPLILLRSGAGNGSGLVGQDLQLHPGLAIMAVFPDPVRPWEGATQGYHSLEYLEEGIKLEVLWAPPAVLAARLPGFGHEFKRLLADYHRMAPFDVFVAAESSRGSVRPKRWSAHPDIRFQLEPEDVARLQRGLGLLADIAWAAGAEAILPGLHGMPESLGRAAGTAPLLERRFEARDAIAAANHAFGTTRMSADPANGVVREDGRCHDLENVYVADTGIFPASPAVNPMLTGMALADRIALGIASLGRT